MVSILEKLFSDDSYEPPSWHSVFVMNPDDAIEMDPDDVPSCDKCGLQEMWRSATGVWRCQNCDPPISTWEFLK